MVSAQCALEYEDNPITRYCYKLSVSVIIIDYGIDVYDLTSGNTRQIKLTKSI